jgi:hypothetical protein
VTRGGGSRAAAGIFVGSVRPGGGEFDRPDQTVNPLLRNCFYFINDLREDDMQARKFCSAILGMVSLVGFLSATARADEATAPPPEAAPVADPAAPPAGAAPAATASAAAASDSKMRVGLDLVPMPFGTLKFSGGGMSLSSDTSVAFGLFPFFDYLITPNFFVGVAPQYTFNVKGKDDSGSAAKEFDILLRVGGGAPVADKIQVYGYLSPGYSIIMTPSGAGPNPKGFVVGAHVGGMLDLTPTLFLNVELGYQVGFQKASEGGVTVDEKSNYAQIGVGGGVRL